MGSEADLINVDSPIHKDAFVSASDAARILGIKPATLYAYVSRGLVRSVGAGRSGGHKYLREDLERLVARKRARSGHAAVAADALRWGEPVLDSAITAIGPKGPHYRGQAAVELVASRRTFEEVAELLWTGTLPPRPPAWATEARDISELARTARAARAALGRVAPVARTLAPLAAATAIASRRSATGLARGRGTKDFAANDDLAQARALLVTLATHAGPRIVRARRSIAETIAVALEVRPTPRAVHGIDAALVLIADHELNVSSFASRVAASAGSSLPASLLAAHTALTGTRHGAASLAVEALLEEARRAERLRDVLGPKIATGKALDGFHHRLYPEGDPRALPLLALARRIGPRRRTTKVVDDLVRYVARARGDRPNVDLGLVALAQALGAPPGTASVLFGMGRAAGWVAHVMEQRAQGVLLRPRARYVGV